jgi:hypothetical protein
MTFAPFNEKSSTTPNPARSAANHRCKPLRTNELAKGARTRTRKCRLNSVVIPSSLLNPPLRPALAKNYVRRTAAPINFPQADTQNPPEAARHTSSREARCGGENGDELTEGYAAVVETIATYFFRRFCAAGDNSVKARPKN